MPAYRLYFMSPRTGHIMRFEAFEAAGDEAALEHAYTHEGANPLELWSGTRKVGRIEPNDPVTRIVSRWSAQAQAAE